MPIPRMVACPDRISWKSSPNGSFEMKEAYRLAHGADDSNSQTSGSGEWIWKVWTIPKIRCFIWQCWHRSIPVRSVLVARGKIMRGRIFRGVSSSQLVFGTCGYSKTKLCLDEHSCQERARCERWYYV
ncbi:hypothetical protein CFP56_042105 [Quercus suber]|uniref:Reverse transcriptase zinc-binding domain-containing protein n=1 Tax=Quercus suber TaxID=58331 RepID=A0AAW0M924_QUESU